jgi:glyoxylase I family protein
VALARDTIDVGIVVRDAEKSLAFYCNVLGLPYERRADQPDGAVIHFVGAGTSSIKLYQPASPLLAAAPVAEFNQAYGYRYLTMFVTNIREILSAAEQAGCAITMPLRESRGGGYLAFVCDPDGNNIELLERH